MFHVSSVNDAPTITSIIDINGSITELTDGHSNEHDFNHTETGSFNFGDVDLSNQTITSWPSASDYKGTFTPTISNNSGGDGSGRVTWDFEVSDNALDDLAAGQVRTQIYTIQLNDGNGGLVQQNVSITLYGRSDAVNSTIIGSTNLPDTYGSKYLSINLDTASYGDLQSIGNTNLEIEHISNINFTHGAGGTIYGFSQNPNDPTQYMLASGTDFSDDRYSHDSYYHVLIKYISFSKSGSETFITIDDSFMICPNGGEVSRSSYTTAQKNLAHTQFESIQDGEWLDMPTDDGGMYNHMDSDDMTANNLRHNISLIESHNTNDSNNWEIEGTSGNNTLIGDDGEDIIFGAGGNDTMTGRDGSDTFVWKIGDGGTAGAPAIDTITDFTTGSGGDVLDLSDLLVGENSGNLSQYLNLQFSGGNTTINVSSTAGGSVVQTITLEGVNIGTHGPAIINNLLDNGNLDID